MISFLERLLAYLRNRRLVKQYAAAWDEVESESESELWNDIASL